jgi:hypothetical protein
MATQKPYKIKGTKVGDADIKVSYGGFTCNIPGKIRVVKMDPPQSNVILPISSNITSIEMPHHTYQAPRMCVGDKINISDLFNTISNGGIMATYEYGSAYQTTNYWGFADITNTPGPSDSPSISDVTPFEGIWGVTIEPRDYKTPTVDEGQQGVITYVYKKPGELQASIKNLANDSVVWEGTVNITGTQNVLSKMPTSFSTSDSSVASVAGSYITALKVGTFHTYAHFEGKYTDVFNGQACTVVEPKVYVDLGDGNGKTAISSFTITRPRGTNASYTASGGSSNSNIVIYDGVSESFVIPTIYQDFGNTNKTITVYYENFLKGMSVTSSNSSIISIGTYQQNSTDGQFTITAKSVYNGATLTFKNGTDVVSSATKTIKITNETSRFDVSSSVSYSEESGIYTLSAKSGAAGSNITISAPLSGVSYDSTANIRAYYRGSVSLINVINCKVTVKKPTITTSPSTSMSLSTILKRIVNGVVNGAIGADGVSGNNDAYNYKICFGAKSNIGGDNIRLIPYLNNITAEYGPGPKTFNIQYTNCKSDAVTITSSNINIISVDLIGSTSATLTAKSSGVSTIIVKHGTYTLYSSQITVSSGSEYKTIVDNTNFELVSSSYPRLGTNMIAYGQYYTKAGVFQSSANNYGSTDTLFVSYGGIQQAYRKIYECNYKRITSPCNITFTYTIRGQSSIISISNSNIKRVMVINKTFGEIDLSTDNNPTSSALLNRIDTTDAPTTGGTTSPSSTPSSSGSSSSGADNTAFLEECLNVSEGGLFEYKEIYLNSGKTHWLLYNVAHVDPASIDSTPNMNGFDYGDTTTASPGSLIFVILLTNGRVITSTGKTISDINNGVINISVDQSPF